MSIGHNLNRLKTLPSKKSKSFKMIFIILLNSLITNFHRLNTIKCIKVYIATVNKKKMELIET